MMSYIFLHVVLLYDLVQEGSTSSCLETLSNPDDVPSLPSQTLDLDEGSLPINVPATEVRVQHCSLYDFLTCCLQGPNSLSHQDLLIL